MVDGVKSKSFFVKSVTAAPTVQARLNHLQESIASLQAQLTTLETTRKQIVADIEKNQIFIFQHSGEMRDMLLKEFTQSLCSLRNNRQAIFANPIYASTTHARALQQNALQHNSDCIAEIYAMAHKYIQDCATVPERQAQLDRHKKLAPKYVEKEDEAKALISAKQQEYSVLLQAIELLANTSSQHKSRMPTSRAPRLG